MQKQYSNQDNTENYSDRRVKIDCVALTHNYNNISKIAANSEVIAYVKGDAYGHGIVGIVSHLRSIGSKMFAVASINELLAIREHFSDVRVLVSSTCFTPHTLDLISRNNGDIVLYHQDHIKLLEEITLPNKLNVWLKFNTGMNRMGINLSDLEQSLIKLQRCNNVYSDDIILMSHFACADDINSSMNEEQLDKFVMGTKNLSLRRTMANSAAIINYPQSHFDIVRPGLILYGISPLINKDDRLDDFKPVMTVEGKVIALNNLHAGDHVGYRASWTSPQDKKIAVISFGYADGYPVSVADGTCVIINEERCPVVGRVSMDTMTVDVSHLATVRLGDGVILWGSSLSVAEVAHAANMIPYELLCHVSRRRTCYIYNYG